MPGRLAPFLHHFVVKYVHSLSNSREVTLVEKMALVTNGKQMGAS
jgi:hypothetical protein